MGDPLDSRGEDFNQSTSTDSVASYYTKATETQTLNIDTSCGTASGHFTVVHTDQVTGEKVTSKNVQVMPQLSSTVTVTVPAAVDTKWCPNSGSHKGRNHVTHSLWSDCQYCCLFRYQRQHLRRGRECHLPRCWTCCKWSPLG